MLDFLKLNLQLFADGGDGGDGGATSSAGEGTSSTDSGDVNVPASIPEKARKRYEQAVKETSAKKTEDNKAPATPLAIDEAKPATEKKTYSELIKSDDYKDEHKAYMDKAIGDRLKRYKGIEEGFNQQKQLLETIAAKYGVNSASETFLQELSEAVEADDSYYESYALEHDIPTDEARKIVTMERRLSQIEAEKARHEEQEQARAQVMRLRQNAEKTKAQFPEFDLDAMMQDERFRRLCYATNEDTTAAYMACRWNDILPATVEKASKQIQTQAAQAVASNKSRPIENGVASTSPSVVETNFEGMGLKEIRAFAAQQIKNAGR